LFFRLVLCLFFFFFFLENGSLRRSRAGFFFFFFRPQLTDFLPGGGVGICSQDSLSSGEFFRGFFWFYIEFESIPSSLVSLPDHRPGLPLSVGRPSNSASEAVGGSFFLLPAPLERTRTDGFMRFFLSDLDFLLSHFTLLANGSLPRSRIFSALFCDVFSL